MATKGDFMKWLVATLAAIGAVIAAAVGFRMRDPKKASAAWTHATDAVKRAESAVAEELKRFEAAVTEELKRVESAGESAVKRVQSAAEEELKRFEAAVAEELKRIEAAVAVELKRVGAAAESADKPVESDPSREMKGAVSHH